MATAQPSTAASTGGITPGYDPTNPTPYTAPSMPEIAPPPALPQQAQDKGMEKGPGMAPAPGSKAAGIAYLAQSFLKGMARGKDINEVKKTAAQQRTLSGLQFVYNNSAAKYLELKQEGVTGQELDQAKAGVDASWSAMMHFYDRYFNPDGGDGKKPKKKKGKDDQASPIQGLMGNDPQAKAQSWYQVALKAGPPVYYQSRQYDSPQYKQQVELKQKQAQAELDNENKRLRLHELEGKKDSLTDQEKEEMEKLREDPELFPSTAGMTPHYATFDTPGASIADGTTDIMGQPIDKTKNYRGVTRNGITSWVPSAPKAVKPIFAWSKDAKGKLYSVEIDPATNQFKPGTENYDKIPPANLLDKIRTGEFSWTDADGNLHRSQTSTTTHPIIPGAASSSPKASGPAAAKPIPNATPAEATKVQDDLKNSKNAPNLTPTEAAKAKSNVSFLKEGETGPLGVKQSPGDRIIGNVGAKGQAKSRAEAAESVLRIMPNALALLKDPNVQKNLGVFNGRWSEIEKRVGNLDPKTQEFYGMLKSIYALNGSMHGWRSLKAPEEFEKAYGDLHTDPVSLLGGLKAVSSTAKDVYETGFHHPWKGTGALAQPGAPKTATPASGAGGANPKNADEYLHSVLGTGTGG